MRFTSKDVHEVVVILNALSRMFVGRSASHAPDQSPCFHTVTKHPTTYRTVVGSSCPHLLTFLHIDFRTLDTKAISLNFETSTAQLFSHHAECLEKTRSFWLASAKSLVSTPHDRVYWILFTNINRSDQPPQEPASRGQLCVKPSSRPSQTYVSQHTLHSRRAHSTDRQHLPKLKRPVPYAR